MYKAGITYDSTKAVLLGVVCTFRTTSRRSSSSSPSSGGSPIRSKQQN